MAVELTGREVVDQIYIQGYSKWLSGF